MQVFDAGSRTLLRQLKAHKRAAHVAHFSPDRMHVLSAADDTTVGIPLCTQPASLMTHMLHTTSLSLCVIESARKLAVERCYAARLTMMIKPKSQLLFNPSKSEETI